MTESDVEPGRAGASAWLWLSALVIALDQLTKWLIVQRFELYDRIEVNALLNITRHHNTGAAFSFLADAGGWQRWLFVALACVISVVIMVWLRRLPPRGQGWLAFALALVLGGALGNVIDRVHLHYVVDFIQVHWGDSYFPTFNVADMAISVGAVLLVLDSFFGSGRSDTAKTEPEPAEDT
ncbi:MAG: signal peptidase II [Pseudomonadota bacterium]